MSTPVVSVIVPNYNHCAFLKIRIDSILQQSYDDFELILLDDCSSDKSREILLSYKENVHVTHIVFNDNNSGSVFKQWKKGISLARGKYIWIAESDDYSDLDFLKETVRALESAPEASLVFTGSQMVDREGKNMLVDWDNFSFSAPMCVRYESMHFLLKRMLWKNSIYNASMVLFKRECYERMACDEYQAFHYCGDWLFWIGICRQGSVVSIRRKLNYFRQHMEKVSPGAEKRGLYFIEGGKIMKYMIDLLQLSFFQQLVISGRTWKRLLKLTRKKGLLRQEIIESCAPILKNRMISIFVYSLDKFINISHLQH